MQKVLCALYGAFSFEVVLRAATLAPANAGLPVPPDFRGAAAVRCGSLRRSLLGRDASEATRQAALLRLLQQGNLGKSSNSLAFASRGHGEIIPYPVAATDIAFEGRSVLR